LNLLQGVQRISDCIQPVQPLADVAASNMLYVSKAPKDTISALGGSQKQSVDTWFLTQNTMHCPLSRRPLTADLNIIQSVWQVSYYIQSSNKEGKKGEEDMH